MNTKIKSVVYLFSIIVLSFSLIGCGEIGKPIFPIDKEDKTSGTFSEMTVFDPEKDISAIKFYQTYGFKWQEMPKDIELPQDYPHIYLFYRFDITKF